MERRLALDEGGLQRGVLCPRFCTPTPTPLFWPDDLPKKAFVDLTSFKAHFACIFVHFIEHMTTMSLLSLPQFSSPFSIPLPSPITLQLASTNQKCFHTTLSTSTYPFTDALAIIPYLAYTT